MIHEDTLFSFMNDLSANRTLILDDQLYLFRKRADAITTGTLSIKHMIGYFVSFIESLRFVEYKALLERWESYEQKKRILGDKRNSYSKTDPDATFMHMKGDHMRNGQLKPGYNVQFAVNSQWIVGLVVFSDRTDYATLPPMLETLKERLGFRFRRVVADAGYERLDNYRYLDQHQQEA